MNNVRGMRVGTMKEKRMYLSNRPYIRSVWKPSNSFLPALGPLRSFVRRRSISVFASSASVAEKTFSRMM